MKTVERHLDRLETGPRQGGAPVEVAVLLLHLGGPQDEDDVERFLLDLWSEPPLAHGPLGRLVGRRRAQRALDARRDSLTKAHRLIGRRSPVHELLAAQALALENHLAGRPPMAAPAGGPARVFAGTRFSAPSIADAAAAARDSGARHVVAVPLYPHEAPAQGGICLAELARAARGTPLASRMAVVGSFGADSAYRDAMLARARHALGMVPPGVRGEARVLFAVAAAWARRRPAWLDAVEDTAQALRHALDVPEERCAVGFHDAAGAAPPVEPRVQDVAAELGKAGAKALLVLPMSFVTDCFETLHGLDIETYQAAVEAGVKQFRRVPSLNAAPDFVAVLAARVAAALPPAARGALSAPRAG